MKTPSQRIASLAAGLAFVSLASCSQIVGIKDLPSDDAGASGGGDDTSNSDRIARFVGVWTISQGSNTVTCSGETPEVTTDTGTLTVVRGTSTDLLMTPPDGCRLGANVTSGNVATLVSGQTCSGIASDGTGRVTFAPSGTFEISTAATAGVVNVGGGVTDVDQGTTVSCTFTQTDDYIRSN